MRAFLLLALLVLAMPVAADKGTGLDAAGRGTGLDETRRDPSPSAEVIDITAERFSFTPSEIKTTAGTTLEFRLHSEDTDHGFKIPGTDINISIPKRGRGTASVTFTPEKPGRYTFQCSHVCGAGHSMMRGVIVVRER